MCLWLISYCVAHLSVVCLFCHASMVQCAYAFLLYSYTHAYWRNVLIILIVCHASMIQCAYDFLLYSYFATLAWFNVLMISYCAARVAGADIALVSAFQGRNNARVVFSGSLDLFSNEYVLCYKAFFSCFCYSALLCFLFVFSRFLLQRVRIML